MKRWKAAMYLRLSRDDGTNLESLSITNQKALLEDWLKDKTDIDVVDCYVDDGYTGTNFDRPGFNDLMFDIKIERIDCVIVKDLSRLGRNSSKTSHLIDDFFPRNGIRFISVNDGMDTLGLVDDNDVTGFKLVCNEFYVKDISKKTKSALRASARKGNYVGALAPYGYKKSDTDYHKLIIDDTTAVIVKQIFNAYASGESARYIADNLNHNNVITPYNYRRVTLGLDVDDSKYWSSATVLQILHNEVYFGNIVYHKREKISYKLDKRRITSEDEHIICNGTHERIVDKDTELLIKNKFASNYSKNKRKNNNGNCVPVLFSGLLRCYDCGSKMPATIKNNKRCYRCYNYNASGSSACSSHLIYESTIEEYIQNDIREILNKYNSNTSQFINSLKNKICSNNCIIINQVTKKRSMALKEIDHIRALMVDLYNDKNKMPTSMFSICAKQYDDNLQRLLKDVDNYDNILMQYEYDNNFIRVWLEKLNSIDSLINPSCEYYHSIIDKIYIKAVGKKQRIIIKYKVGFITNSDNIGGLIAA